MSVRFDSRAGSMEVRALLGSNPSTRTRISNSPSGRFSSWTRPSPSLRWRIKPSERNLRWWQVGVLLAVFAVWHLLTAPGLLKVEASQAIDRLVGAKRAGWR